MTDQYTQYPEHLKARIANANKMITDIAAFKALPPDQQEAKLKEWEAQNLPTPEPEPTPEPTPEPSPEPVPEPAPSGDTVESLTKKLETAEQRNRTLQGMIKEPADENRFLKNQLALLQEQILSLKGQIAQKAPEPTPKKVALGEALKEEVDSLKQELAPDIVDKIMKITEKVYVRGQEEAQRSITEVANQVDGKMASSAKDRFDRDVLDAYPNWAQMWKTEEFQTWGWEPDGLSGISRFDVIERAFNRFDSRTVIKSFDLFTGKKANAPQPTAQGLDPSNPKVKNRIAAPAGAPTPQNLNLKPGNNKPTMDPAVARRALLALGADYSRGVYKGREDVYKKEHARLSALTRAPAGTS